jgi:hypothetical protein
MEKEMIRKEFEAKRERALREEIWREKELQHRENHLLEEKAWLDDTERRLDSHRKLWTSS